MGPSYSDGIARLDLAQEKDCVERTYQVRDFFTIVGNEVAKQRRKNKTFKDSYGFTIVLQIQFGFFPGSRNKQKQVILDSYYMKNFLLYKQSVNDQACSVKIAGYWHNFFFCAFTDHDFASVH